MTDCPCPPDSISLDGEQFTIASNERGYPPYAVELEGTCEKCGSPVEVVYTYKSIER